MTLTKQYRSEFLSYLDRLPEDKLVELKDFAAFLLHKTMKSRSTQVTEASLRLQQAALEHVWDDPAEELYEL